MSAKIEKPGLFSRLGGIIIHNWWLKLFALILAIIVYQSIKTDWIANSAENHAQSLPIR